MALSYSSTRGDRKRLWVESSRGAKMKRIKTPTIAAVFVRNLLLAGIFSSFVGCAVGPDYEAPIPDIPEQYDAAPHSATPNPTEHWWASFNDAVLARCIQEALNRNQDIQIGVERIRIARAMRRMESSSFYPQIDTQLSYTVDRLSENNPRFEDAIRQGFFPRDGD